MPALEENVLRLDVAMDDADRVGVLQGVGDLAGNAQRIVERKLALAVEPSAKCLAPHVRHHVVEQRVRGPAVEEREDVRVLEPRRRPDLAQEPLAA